MENPISLAALSSDIRTIFRENELGPESAIEKFLQDELQDIPDKQQLTVIRELRDSFSAVETGPEKEAQPLDREGFTRLISLLLGKRGEGVDQYSDETLEKLAGSLNTVFDSLNEIISGINATFMGKSIDTEETIRLVISSNLDRQEGLKSLEQYLNQIKEAFAISHKAFQQAARTKMQEMLDNLSPAVIVSEVGKGIKMGPFHKAEMYDIFCEKYITVEKWLQSGIFVEALLREFEKNCQKFYSQKGGI